MSWWQELYDEEVAALLLERASAPDELERTCEFLIRELELSTGHRIFDQCCGIGNLSRALAERGMTVVGVDQAARYIERARRDAHGTACEFHVGDAFDFVPASPVSAAFNWWTSFGYTTDDERNAQMLRRAYEALAPGGHFALDTLGLAGVLRHFQPRVESRCELAGQPVTLVRETSLDWHAGMMRKRWRFTRPGHAPKTIETEVRLYLPHSLRELFQRVGFVDVRLFGGLGSEPLTLDSTRTLVLGTKPA